MNGGAWFASLAQTALHDEPPIDGQVAAVFRRADKLRRRRIRTVVTGGLAAVVAVGALGYGLTSALLPRTAPRPVAIVPAGGTETAAPVDQVLAVLAPIASGLVVTPRPPARGSGWRQYAVREKNGRARGLIAVSVYSAPDGLCFPVLADDEACARPNRAGADHEYVRYTFDADEDWQVTEVMARRVPDGRTVVVQATGERGTGDRTAGRPPLTPAQAATAALDDRLTAGFSSLEACNGPDPGCPLLKVPVPVAD